MIEKPKCLNNLSFRKYLKAIAIEKLYETIGLDIKGCLASAQMSADPILYLKNKRAEFNEKICQECQVLGVSWQKISCNIDRINEFYLLSDGLLRECVGDPTLEQVLEKESRLFVKYITFIMSINEAIEKFENQTPSKRSLGGKYNEAQLSRIFLGLKDNGYLTSSSGTIAFVNMGMNKSSEGGLRWIKKNEKNKLVSKSALLSLLKELGFENQTQARMIANEHFRIDLNRSTKPSKEHTTKIKEIILKATR